MTIKSVTFPSVARIRPDGKSGPFVMGDGNIYAVCLEGTTASDNYLYMYRSTDGGVTWQRRSMLANGPSSQALIGSYSAVKVDNNTIAYAYLFGVTAYIDWYDINSGLSLGGGFLETGVPATAEIDLAARSNGQIVVAYHGLQVKSMGSTYDRLFAKVYGYRQLGSISTLALTPSATQTDRFPVVTLGKNDLVHIHFMSGLNAVVRTVSGTTLLSNAPTASTLGVTTKPHSAGATYGPLNNKGIVLRTTSSTLQAYTYDADVAPSTLPTMTLANSTIVPGPVMATTNYTENGEYIAVHAYVIDSGGGTGTEISTMTTKFAGASTLLYAGQKVNAGENVTAVSLGVSEPSPQTQVLHYLAQTPSGLKYGEITLVEGAPPALPEAISSADTSSVSITDTATRTILNDAKTGGDTVTASVADTAHILKIMQATDSGTLSLTESRSFGTIDVQRSDAGSVSVSDSGGLPPQSISASDSGSLSVSDTGALGTIAISANDSGTVSATESVTITVALSRADAGAVSATDTRSTFNPRAAGDSGASSIVESFVIQVVLNAADNGLITAEDARTTVVGRIGSDASTVSATESTSGYREIAASDSFDISTTETSQQHLDRILSDAGTVIAVDEAEVTAFGSFEKPGVDEGTVFMVDDMVILVTRTISDSGTVSLADSATIVRTGTFAISAGDAGSPSITDTVVVAKTAYKSAADSGSASTTESTSSAVSGLVLKQSADLSTTSAADTTNRQTTFDTKRAADSGSVSLADTTEKEISGLVEISAGDSGSVLADDTTQQGIELDRQDGSDVSLDESTGNVPADVAPFSVYVWDGSEWVEGQMFVWDGTKWAEPELRYYDGNTWI